MDDLMQELETLVKKEIRKIVQKGDLTPVELDNATKAVCLLRKIEGFEEGEYEDSNSYRMPYRESPDRPMYSNRRTRSTRTGHYMSRDTGMSGHSIVDRAIAALESMVDTAQTDYERQQIIEMIDKIRE